MTKNQYHRNIHKESTVTINVNGELVEIQKRLDKFMELLEQIQARSFQTAEKIYNIGSITNANFGFVIGQAAWNKALPADLAEGIIRETSPWVGSLKQELLKNNVAVGNSSMAIFQHYGWLIEEFLRKLETKVGKERTLRRLSFMAEAFQNSLRYLCFIQVSQILTQDEKTLNPLLSEFIQMPENRYREFDFLNLLVVSTGLFPEEKAFVPEIYPLVRQLTDSHSDLFGAALFLEKYRNLLLQSPISEIENLDALLDEYLTALVYWLRKIAFLARYRLVSIKDIQLKYRLGTTKNFVHLYGELHGFYSEAISGEDGYDYREVEIEGLHTFNHSVLLFNDNSVEKCLSNIHNTDTYISLSPLVVDKSVFSEKETQTPEICYYTGYHGRQYRFVLHNKELELGEHNSPSVRKEDFSVKAENINQPKLNELFEQMEHVFQSYKGQIQ